MVQTGWISGAKWVFRWCKMGVSVVQTVFQTALIRGLRGPKIFSTISTISTTKTMPVLLSGKRAYHINRPLRDVRLPASERAVMHNAQWKILYFVQKGNFLGAFVQNVDEITKNVV